MINVQGLSKVYETKKSDVLAIEDISFKVKTGSVTTLLGPNGAGKSTTVRILATIIRPSVGTAEIGGYDVRNDGLQIRQLIGLAPESPSLYGRLSARRNLKFFADLHDIQKNEQRELINTVLKQFDLLDVADHNVNGFSRGMRQKLSLAASILHEPHYLFLDEPWSGLSPHASKEVTELILQLTKDHKTTVLISTHNLTQVEKIVDKIVIINKGKIITDRDKSKLYQEYAVSPGLKIQIKNYQVDKLKKLLSLIQYINQDLTRIEDDIIFIYPNNFSKTPEIIRQLVKGGLDIFEIKKLVPSIEEFYFRNITEGEN